jgi:hypothetical protein
VIKNVKVKGVRGRHHRAGQGRAGDCVNVASNSTALDEVQVNYDEVELELSYWEIKTLTRRERERERERESMWRNQSA